MRKTKTAEVEVKTGGEVGLEEGEFIAYPSTFTREPDSYGDVVAAGAFAKTIEEWKESGNILPILYGHRLDDPDYNIGGALEMSEDEHGWLVKGYLDLEKPKAKQVYDLLKAKRLSQLSFAFDVLDEAQVELEDGRKANELRVVKVYEASFVPIGANQDTSVVEVKAAVRSVAAKAGRVISAKNEETLHKAARELTDALAGVQEVLAQLDGETDAAKAADSAPLPTVEPVKAQPERSPANILAHLITEQASI